jgi:hypothetical protein
VRDNTPEGSCAFSTRRDRHHLAILSPEATNHAEPNPCGPGKGAPRRADPTTLQILADTMMLRDLYKKHHWQVAGHSFYELHLLLDKHYSEPSTLFGVFRP